MKKLTFIIIVISIGFSQIKSPKHGMGLNVGDIGAGLFYHRNIKSFNYTNIGVTLRWFDVRPAEEIPSYNYYTGRYDNKNTLSLAIFPLFGTINYYPFEGKIANNFSPFVSGKLGPVLVLNADDEIESFTKRWGKAKSDITYGVNIGIGAEFRQPGRLNYSVELSYDLIPLSNAIGEYSNLHGTVLSFSIHR